MLSLSILLLFVGFGSGYILESDEPTQSIIWPSEYHLKGDVTDLYTAVIMPFEMWYSAEQNRSRIDHYGGMDRIYYRGETEDESGRKFRIFPVSMEDGLTNNLCVEESNIDIEDFLPSTDSLEYSGQKTYDRRLIQVWSYVKTEKIQKEEKTLYVYRTDDGVDIPVRMEVISYNTWTGGQVGHVVTNYYDFKLPASEDLVVQDDLDCDEMRLGKDLNKYLKFYHPQVSKDLNKVFNRYKQHHRRKYKGDEHQMRKTIFQTNWRRVIAHNRKNSTYKLEINKFADRTREELAQLMATRPSQGVGSVEFPYKEAELRDISAELPENFDMRLDGVISSVKNQSNCGSCWAFASTAAVEGALSRSNGGRNIELSEQTLIDCAWGFGNMGCMGGFVDKAFEYILKHGIPTQREYGPYLNENGYCHKENMTEVYTIKGFGRVTPLSVEGMKVALYKYGPVTVAIYATKNLALYSSGIFFDAECIEDRVNHGVTVVGYGVRNGTLYWIVKNSWGEEWGQDGYVLMSAENNNCFVLSYAYYPIV